MPICSFKIPCETCDGQGKLAVGNGNDPSVPIVDCDECDSGWRAVQEEYEDPLDLQDDHPEAVNIIIS